MIDFFKNGITELNAENLNDFLNRFPEYVDRGGGQQIESCDHIGNTGVYHIDENDVNRPSGIGDGTNNSYAVQATFFSSAWATMLATDYRSNRVWARRKTNGVWSAWTELGSGAVGTVKAPPVTLSNVAIGNLQATIESLPKLLNYDVTINVNAGTYNGTITVQDFFGNGALIINGASTAQSDSHKVNNFVVQNNSNFRVSVCGFTAMNTTGYSFNFIRNTSYCYIYQCNARLGSTTDSGNFGVGQNESGGMVYVSSCEISSKYRAFRCLMGKMHVAGSFGQGNAGVYSADNGGDIIIRSLGTISGDTVAARANGGQIYGPNEFRQAIIVNRGADWNQLQIHAANGKASIIGSGPDYLELKSGNDSACTTATSRRIRIHNLGSVADSNISKALTFVNGSTIYNLYGEHNPPMEFIGNVYYGTPFPINISEKNVVYHCISNMYPMTAINVSGYYLRIVTPMQGTHPFNALIVGAGGETTASSNFNVTMGGPGGGIAAVYKQKLGV